MCGIRNPGWRPDESGLTLGYDIEPLRGNEAAADSDPFRHFLRSHKS